MTKRKIGIITFHRAHNFGAILQTYALFKYIDKNFGNVEVIDYVPNNQIPKYNRYLSFFLHGCLNILLFFKRKNIILKEYKFKKFRKKINISNQTLYGDNDPNLKKLNYSVLVSGSDQILNLSLSGNSKAYYLHFNNNSKKISYASSFGREKITNEEKEMISSELSKFEFLSSREISGCHLIEGILNRDVTFVMDPVFLLSKDEWLNLCMNTRIKEDYVLIYSMENSDLMISIINILKKQGFNLVIINGGKKTNYEKYGNVIYCAGPMDFLNYINNAKFIVTNSFHGLAFSLIFNKKVLCVKHSNKNDRLFSLLKLINMNDKQIIDSVTFNYNEHIIDGEKHFSKLNDKIIESKKYLENSLR